MSHRSLLLKAVCEGNLIQTKSLILSQEYNLLSPDPTNGWPLLFYAVKYHHNQVFHYLLEYGHEDEGVSKDFAGNTCLIIAALYQNEEALKSYLIKMPGSLNMVNERKQSALIIASQMDCRNCFQSLIDAMPFLDQQDELGMTALHQ